MKFLENVDKFGLNKQRGEEILIWDLVHKLRENDGLWLIQGKIFDGTVVRFEALFNGHVMVPLSLPVAKKSGVVIEEEELEEIARCKKK